MEDYTFRFEAIRGQQNNSVYFIAQIPFRVLASMVELDNSDDVNDRSQRELNKSRAKAISLYLCQNFNKTFTVIPPLIGFINDEYTFEEVQLEQFKGVGKFKISMDIKLKLFDGQHRSIGIKEAIQIEPALAGNTVPVMFFVGMSLKDRQQAFHDINFTQKTPAKALCIAYNGRSSFDSMVVNVFKESPIKHLIDYEKNTVSGKNPYLYSLKTLQEFSTLVLGGTEFNVDDVEYLEQYVSVLTNCLGITQTLDSLKHNASAELPAVQLREYSLITQVVMVKALGMLGNFVRSYDDWPHYLEKLGKDEIFYRDPHWIGVCLTEAGKLRASKRAIQLTFLELKSQCGLELSEEDTQFILQNKGDI